MILSSGLMHRFELTIPPSPAWIDLARDLVATGATPLDLGLDRFQDLLVITTHTVSEAVETPGASSVMMRMGIGDQRLELSIETKGGVSGPFEVSDLVLSVLADEHRREVTDDGLKVDLAIHR